jgi:predicted transcriptional regulator
MTSHDGQGTSVNQLPKSIRITGERREQLGVRLARKYQAGQSIRALAEATGRSYGFVHRLLDEQPDVTFRSRGGNTRSPASDQQR